MKKRWTKWIVFMLALIMTLSMGMSASAKDAALKKGSTFTRGNLTYKVTSLNGKKGTVKVISAKKGTKSVSIPSTVKRNGCVLTVDTIAEGAFKNCTKLQKVTTCKTLKKIGKNAFAGCKKLNKLDLSASKKLKSVGKNVLKGASKVKVTVPDVKDASYYSKKLGVAKSKIVVTGQKKPETDAPQPETTAPETTAPETDAPQTETTAPETPEPETPAPETDAPQPETTAPETPAPETDAPQPETTAPETTEPETDAPQTETTAPETTAPETDAPQPETTAPETPEPETDAPQTETTAPETPEPETDAPETDAPPIQDSPAIDAPGAETIPPQTSEEPRKTCSGGNHVFTAEWAVSKAATCAEWESLYRYCECRGSMESTLGAPPTGNHVYEHHKIESTCEKEGSEWDICTGCGQKINVTTIPAKGGHKFDRKVTDHESSCDGSGYGHYECSICGKRGNSFNIPAGSHAWVESHVAPTCATYGYTKRTCSNCGRSEEIAGTREAKLAHTFTVESTTPVSCETDGVTVQKCTACGHQETIITGKRTGHSWGTPVTVQKSTCQQEGIVRYTCATCKDTKDVTTPRSDHRWVLGSDRNGLDHCAYCGTKFPYPEQD